MEGGKWKTKKKRERELHKVFFSRIRLLTLHDERAQVALEQEHQVVLHELLHVLVDVELARAENHFDHIPN